MKLENIKKCMDSLMEINGKEAEMDGTVILIKGKALVFFQPDDETTTKMEVLSNGVVLINGDARY